MFVHAHAPVRIGIAGGGTDLPAWTRDRVGLCLSLAIRTHVHAVAIARPDRQVVASYSRLDRAVCATEIANGLVRESALLHGFEDGFEVHTLSEISSQGSGLGASSAIAVVLAACFQRMAEIRDGRQGADCLALDRAAIARAAWTVEIDRLRRPIGRQDHMAAAWGGLRLYAFEGSGARVERSFSAEDAAWVASRLVLVRLRGGHDARAILGGVTGVESLHLAREAVDEAVRAVESRDGLALGHAIRLGHRSKAQIPGVATEEVERAVERAEAVAGVLGCKVAGAGGGGHLVVCIEQDAEAVVPALQRALGLEVIRVEPDVEGVWSEGS